MILRRSASKPESCNSYFIKRIFGVRMIVKYLEQEDKSLQLFHSEV